VRATQIIFGTAGDAAASRIEKESRHAEAASPTIKTVYRKALAGGFGTIPARSIQSED